MSGDTLFNVFARLEAEGDRPREKEFAEISIGNRLQKIVIIQRQRCTHEDGRFGLLLTFVKAGRNNLHGSVIFEAFETPSGDLEFLGESPEQAYGVARKHEEDCPECKGSGRDHALERLCRRCGGGGRVERRPEQVARKVTIMEW
ncbi:MAG TPA: hypothetical protein VIP46_02710 [Pyrinomonadaceae bacterium]